jgi:hypothetical protein
LLLLDNEIDLEAVNNNNNSTQQKSVVNKRPEGWKPAY